MNAYNKYYTTNICKFNHCTVHTVSQALRFRLGCNLVFWSVTWPSILQSCSKINLLWQTMRMQYQSECKLSATDAGLISSYMMMRHSRFWVWVITPASHSCKRHWSCTTQTSPLLIATALQNQSFLILNSSHSGSHSVLYFLRFCHHFRLILVLGRNKQFSFTVHTEHLQNSVKYYSCGVYGLAVYIKEHNKNAQLENPATYR